MRLLRWGLLIGLTLLSVTRPVSARAAERPELMIETRYRAYMCYSLGRLLEVEGQLADALVQYRRAAAFDPEGCEPGVAAARVLLGMQRFDDALAEITVARGLCPENGDAVAVHARVLMARERYAEAREVLEDAGPTAPGEVVYLIAQTLVHEGRYEEAEAFYRERTEADSLDPLLALDHARTLMLLERPEEAVGELRRALRLDPNNEMARVMLARILLGSGHTEEGVVVLEKVIRSDVGRIADYIALARAYGAVGRIDDAEGLLTEASRRFPNSQRVFTEIGAVSHDRGRPDDALEAFAKVLEINPESVRALNFIAYTLAEEERDLDRALDYGERAVALAPDNPRVLDTLGWVYFRLGRLDDARERLEAAAALPNPPAAVFQHLGDVLYASGNEDAAVSAWRTALRIRPGLEAVLERLNRVGVNEAQGEDDP